MGKKNKNTYLVEKSKPYVKQIVNRAMNDFMACARETNNAIYDEVVDMYNTFIEEFYSYRTTSYIRFLEGKPGTGEGSNLLDGKKFKKNNRASHSPKLIIEFSGEGIVDYNRHRWDTPDQILDCVMHGIRFPYATGASGPMMVETPFVYNGKYWHYNFDTIQEAFDNFGRQWDSISQDAFYSRWDKYVNTWV